MARFDWGTMDPDIETGTTLAAILDNFRDALNTLHSGGSTRPTYVQPGMLWLDNGIAAEWKLKIYISPGVGDVTLATVNSNNGELELNVEAQDVTYDNSTSGLAATNVQEAIDELAQGVSDVDFDNVLINNNLRIADGANLIFMDGSAETFRARMSGSTWVEERWVTAAWNTVRTVNSTARFEMYSSGAIQFRTTANYLEFLPTPRFNTGIRIEPHAYGIQMHAASGGNIFHMRLSQNSGYSEFIANWNTSQTAGATFIVTGSGNAGPFGQSQVTIQNGSTVSRYQFKANEFYCYENARFRLDFTAELN